ncbi:unnamed protein product [Paramecium primaurelia]|uniref:Phosphatidic acid phosphatase type 2/haloperoxidase domain-containing protein n=1 Tax=Paramecium primaurelia TaxID=5886 RepID=A0A8S1Q9H4_PARPR|nr:unnamed protein product [Paramecium primaurelia]
MNKLILSIVFTTFLVAYVILDVTFDDELWVISKSFAKSMQQSIPTFELVVYEFFTYLVFIPPLAAFYCFIYDDNKLNSLLYLAVVIASATTNELLKSIYHQARPYMIETDIQSLKCNSDYGKPSGHSQNSVVMIILMPILLFPQIKNLGRNKVQVEIQKDLDRSESHTGYTINSLENSELENSQLEANDNIQSKFQIAMKLIIISFLLTSIIMTGISRVFLGVHSIGQVLLGWVWGLYITLMYVFIIHDSLKRYILNLFYPQQSKHKEMNHFIPMAFFLLLVLLGLSLGLLKLNSLIYYERLRMSSWIEKINQCKQTNYTRDSPQILYNSCFQFTGIGAIITGLLVGAVLVQGSYDEGNFNKWKLKLSKTQFIKRLLSLLIPFIILIPFVFITSNNVVVQLMCKILPISFGVGIIINGVFPFLLRKFNLQIPGDFLFLCQSQYLLCDLNKDSLQQQVKEYNDSYQNML